jgi:hypothetical protein
VRALVHQTGRWAARLCRGVEHSLGADAALKRIERQHDADRQHFPNILYLFCHPVTAADRWADLLRWMRRAEPGSYRVITARRVLSDGGLLLEIGFSGTEDAALFRLFFSDLNPPA